MLSPLKTLFCGLCMGAADIVPGISGGTIAFIMGFYSQLIESIKRPFCRSSIKFLSALAGGMVLAFGTLAAFFDYILGHEVYRVFLYSGFIGLIGASIILCARHVEAWNGRSIASLLIGGLLAFALTGTTLQPASSEEKYDIYYPLQSSKFIENYDYSRQMITSVTEATAVAMLSKGVIGDSTPIFNHALNRSTTAVSLRSVASSGSFLNPWLICCGAIAITAMLLPGISGSYLLTILGAYSLVIGALADLTNGAKALQFDLDAALVLGNLLIGIVLGALAFSRVISWLLSSHRSMTIALLIGFMIGALRSVWPFWSYSYTLNPLKLAKGPLLQVVSPILPDVGSPLFFLSLLFAASGFGLVFLVEAFSEKRMQPKVAARG